MNMMTETAVKNVRNTTVLQKKMQLDKMLSLWKVAAWKLHNFLQNLHILWRKKSIQESWKVQEIYKEVRGLIVIKNVDYFFDYNFIY